MVTIAESAPPPEPRRRKLSPERREWLRLKRAVAQEAKAAERAARKEARAKRKPLAQCTEQTRIWRESQLALAELHRNRRRWEEN